MPQPIQVVLNPRNFLIVRESSPPAGPKKDFFQNRDNEFERHQQALLNVVSTIRNQLLNQSQTGQIGYLKVKLKEEALAKSHRPTKALFKANRTPIVGGLSVGEMLIEVTPSSLKEVEEAIQKAEVKVVLKPVKKSTPDKLVPFPSEYRHEVGSIQDIALFTASDRRNFSAADAVKWLNQGSTGGGYIVELFHQPPPAPTWDNISSARRELYQSFISGLQKIKSGLLVQAIEMRATPTLFTRVQNNDSVKSINFVSGSVISQNVSTFNSDIEKHQELLTFLESHPLVKSISLPPIIFAPFFSENNGTNANDLPAKDPNRTYPRIGVIDGGVGAPLNPWIIGKWDNVANQDLNYSHGTFIGGLLTVGKHINGADLCKENDGVEIYDASIFPEPSKFSQYYPFGITGFLEELENSVVAAKTTYGVRVFNLSLGSSEPVQSNHYSFFADRLDNIAMKHDVVFFIAAGNLNQFKRPEWPSDANQALAMLASIRNDGLNSPAESVLNQTVGAVNPNKLGLADFAPTNYTRRGPGLVGQLKPDLAHVGGAGQKNSGLLSLAPNGTIIPNAGTSFAAPLVSKTAACLDHLIEGEVSRETLQALLVHHADHPECLKSDELHSVAHHLVGYGLPPTAEEILVQPEHQISLVFATRLLPQRQLEFTFNWPPSLVNADGRCRGKVKLTLVYSPPTDSAYGAECIRAALNASLQQQDSEPRQSDGKVAWKGRLKPVYKPDFVEDFSLESERVKFGLKWSNVKVFEASMRGIGKFTTWRLFVDYLTRAEYVMPKEGIPFTAILTIEDADQEKPVFQDMRLGLGSIGVRLADIQTAARVKPRV